MRSKIGTQSRLAAHILAFFLLILLLVYLAPPQSAVTAGQAAAQAAVTEAPEPPAAAPVAEAAPEVVEPKPEPETKPEPGPKPEPEPAVVIEQIAPPMLPQAPPLSLRPPAPPAAETPAAPEAAAVDIPAEPAAPVTPVAPPEPPAPLAEPLPPPPSSEEEPSLPEAPAAPAEEEKETDAEELPAPAQPDESGALVVAPSDAGTSEPVAAPLKNAHLEVLNDGVYWLSPGHDLEEELSAIPELAELIVLTPLAGYTMSGFDAVKKEVFPARPVDCAPGAAERFVRLVEGAARPVVVAPLPGVRGAAFFKAAYLLKHRNMTEEDILREIKNELDGAGHAREDVLSALHLLLNPEPDASADADAEAIVETALPNAANDTGGN